MKKYLSYFRIRLIHSMQYRAAALAGIAAQFFWGIMYITLYRVVNQSSPEQYPMAFSATVSYIWLQQGFYSIFTLWRMDNDILDSIVNGNVAYEFCRPIDIYSMWFYKNAGLRASNFLIKTAPVLMVASLLPKPYRLSPPDTPLALGLFLVSTLLAFVLIVALSMIIYGISFYTISSDGIRKIALSLVEFLSGAIIPLPFFPDGLRAVAELLPFASTANTPYLIYSGSYAGNRAAIAVLLQLVWIVATVFLGRKLMGSVTKKAVVQGG